MTSDHTRPPDSTGRGDSPGEHDRRRSRYRNPVEFVPPDERAPRSNRVALIIIFVGFLAVVAAIIGGIAIGRSGEPIGDAREPVDAACATTQSALRDLGKVPADASLAELAERVDTESTMLREMTATIAAAKTGNRDGQRALEGWLADWNSLIAARDAAADTLRAGDAPTTWLPPIETGKSEGIDGRIDEYARRERIPSCTTDVLEADNLLGQRIYRDIKGSTQL